MEYTSRPEQAIAAMVNSAAAQPVVALATALKPDLGVEASPRNKQLNDLLFGSVSFFFFSFL